MFSEKYSRRTALTSGQRVLDDTLTDAELASLSRSEEARIRAAVAEQPATPLTTLLKLASDDSAAVRVGVARNQRPDMPEDLHAQLAEDDSADVIYALIDNPAVSDALIGRLARQFHKEYASTARSRLASKGGAAGLLGRLGISAR